ncbi:CinA family protein [Limosilactobacillus gastricus]|nr:nicotinamide-nucleotide amidohydrolase family protein [Limosilactobacillus gastricus]
MEMLNQQLVNVAQEVVAALKDRQWKITAAESLTAGMFQSTIASVAGASAIFDGGFVTYAASAKANLLKIDPQLIQQHGVVSSPVAGAMARNASQIMKAQIGVGLSGVAGPDSLEGHPAGTVWLGIAINGQVKTKCLHLDASQGRQAVRQQSVLEALRIVLNELEK